MIVVVAKTLSCNCFYEGQGRLDGAICHYDEAGKFRFLRTAYDRGVRNIEMEALQFASFTRELGIPAATLCVALIDRMVTDQVTISGEEIAAYEEHPGKLICEFIRKSVMAPGATA